MLRAQLVLTATVLLWFGCAGTRTAAPRREGGADTGSLQFKETGWTPSWPDGAETGPPEASPIAIDLGSKDKPPLPPDQPPKPDLPPPPCPGGCDDSDPCTSDACNGTSCDHTPIGQIIVRYYNPGTAAHAYAPAGASFPGFAAEGPVFRTLAAPSSGSQPIYQQMNGKDYLLSLSASEGVGGGYQSWGSIGHGFAAQPKGTVPLYRLYHAGAALHLSSLIPTEGTGGGYVLEGVTAHVCP
jgi:hypothetical protein